MTASYSLTDLVEAAAQVREQAYAKFSDYKVGAALLAEDGTIFSGCNVENSSFGLTICAERSAVTAAVSAGRQNFQALALVSSQHGAPCGACRQVLAEFCGDDFPIHVAAAEDLGDIKTSTLGELLPDAFRF